MTETEEILRKDHLSVDDIAYLTMHYVDDYTVESNWALPVVVTAEGKNINDFDRRMDKNDARYPQLKVEGAFDQQRRLGYMVEERLAELISNRQGQEVQPKKLPEIIDQKIKRDIVFSTSATI